MLQVKLALFVGSVSLKGFLEPLHPNISIYVLSTVLYTFDLFS